MNIFLGDDVAVDTRSNMVAIISNDPLCNCAFLVSDFLV